MCSQIHVNTIRNRMSLQQFDEIIPILFDTYPNASDADFENAMNISAVLETKQSPSYSAGKRPDFMKSLTQLAIHFGWRVFKAPRVTPHGVPYFKEMFKKTEEEFPNCVFYGYTNGDLLFTDGLLKTLQAIQKVRLIQRILQDMAYKSKLLL